MQIWYFRRTKHWQSKWHFLSVLGIVICVDRELERNEQVCCVAQGQDYGCFEDSSVLPSDNVGRLG